MNLSRFLSYSRRLFDKFYPCTVSSALTVMKPGAGQSKFFSVFDSPRSLKSSELTLTPFSPFIFNFRGMKVRGRLQLRCKDCYYERKDGIMYVMCSSYPRHKQRIKTKKAKYNWILTFSASSKFRPY